MEQEKMGIKLRTYNVWVGNGNFIMEIKAKNKTEAMKKFNKNICINEVDI